MTNNSIKEDLLSNSFATTTSSNSSPDYHASQCNAQSNNGATSSFESQISDSRDENNSSKQLSLSELFQKSEHQLGDTNFKFIRYNSRVTTYSIIISSILTLFVFGYMILFREQMFVFSLEFIERMQSNQNFFLVSFMNFISLCVSPKPVISMLVIFFALSTQKLKILTFLLYYGFLTYTCVLLKSLFGDPRPYWIEQHYSQNVQQNYVNESRILSAQNNNSSDIYLNQLLIQHYNNKSLNYFEDNDYNLEENFQRLSNKQQLNLIKLSETDKLSNILISETSQEPEIKKQANTQVYLNQSQIINNSNKFQDNQNMSYFSNSTIPYNESHHNKLSNDLNNQRNSQDNLNIVDQDEYKKGYNKTQQNIQQQKEISEQKESQQINQLNSIQNDINPSVLPLDWKCYQEYGNPSGHAFLGVPLYEFIVRDYILRKIGKDQRFIRVLVTVCAVILVNLIFISRLYLGMHSLNQVIFGCVLGIYATVFYRLFFERRISSMLYQYVQLKRSNAIKQISYVILFTSAIFSLPIIIYTIQELILSHSQNLQNQLVEWENIIQQKCSNFTKMQSFHHKCFIDSSVVAIGFSIVLGFLLTSRERFLKGQYKEIPGIKNFIYRISIILLCCSTIAIFYYVLPSFNNPYLKYIYLFLGIFLTGFLLVALVPKLFEKYHLITFIFPLLQEQLNDISQNDNIKQQIKNESFNSYPSFSSFQTEASYSNTLTKDLQKL
ncbi:PAP2 superfamily protein (macronuclear) [Tetrahymena thermophila SB210]|uniref:PAP2 superfamily protein n=1 Tax=Tetrahymena thermophila (strain SB210) TaxID=312017 RepID=I7LY79_TETTS|nr:PAP2 superfamily protein [Tetrahymena thermophila SB210]EAS07871.1 PAP2 superfamily protein [Tetrahymena thermophila SB210]|eukprot:XP_001028113.1 PAP2 superfamily protein [Tetrahymena thermophila SB210]